MAAPPIIVHVDGGTSRVSVPRPPPMQPLSALLAAAAASLKPPVDPALCTLSINGKPMTGAALETALRFAGVTPGVKVALETPRVRGLGFAAMGTAGGGEEAARGSGGVLSAPRPAVAAASAPAAAAAPEPAQAVPAPPAVPPPAPAASPARPLGRPPLARAPAPPTATTLLDAGCPLGVGVPVAVFTLEDAAAAAAAAAQPPRPPGAPAAEDSAGGRGAAGNPHWAYSFPPHAQACPPSSTARQCQPPMAAWTMRRPRRAAMRRGLRPGRL
jgi:hypothetical protein